MCSSNTGPLEHDVRLSLGTVGALRSASHLAPGTGSIIRPLDVFLVVCFPQGSQIVINQIVAGKVSIAVLGLD